MKTAAVAKLCERRAPCRVLLDCSSTVRPEKLVQSNGPAYVSDETSLSLDPSLAKPGIPCAH